jgi:TatD DNase family protein
MSLNLIDTHCHLDLTLFDADRDAVLQQAFDNSVSDIIIPAIMANHWENIKKLTAEQSNLHPAYGLHPMFMSQRQLPLS